MAHESTQEEIVRVLRKIKALGGLADLATAADLARRTVYRHAQDDGRQREMDGATEAKLMVALDDLGLLGTDPSHLDYARAVVELRRRASNRADRRDMDAGEAEGLPGSGRGRKVD